MNPEHIPCNALIVGSTGCGKTQFVVGQLLGPFRYKFDYIILLCPTYVNNKTWSGIGIADDEFFVDILDPNELSNHLKFWHKQFSSREARRARDTQTLLILDDIACGDDVKRRTSELVKLAFSGRHDSMSVWLLSQQLTSVSKPFRENIRSLVVSYTRARATWRPSLVTMVVKSNHQGAATRIYAAPEDAPAFQDDLFLEISI